MVMNQLWILIVENVEWLMHRLIIIEKVFVMIDMMLIIFKDKIFNPSKNNFYY